MGQLRKKRKQMDKKGLKTGGGEGKPKEKRENEWISRGLKQGGGRGGACQPQKKEKTNGFVGLKQGAGWAS